MCKYTTIYAIVDDFCKIYEESIKSKLICSKRGGEIKKRKRIGKLSLSEKISIMIFYHFSGYKNFKVYYEHFIVGSKLFRDLPCYDRFIQIIPSLFLPLTIMMHYMSGRSTGTYFCDSTHFAVCRNIRISQNKTFTGLAARGRSSIDWFYGFKLHMIINDRSEIVAIKITKGGKDDRAALSDIVRSKNIKGKVYADKGYISQDLFSQLYKRGLTLITGIKRNMKNYLMPLFDKIMLKKRFIIETVFGYIKENFNIRPNKARSPTNFFISILAALVAYQILPSKPKLSRPYP